MIKCLLLKQILVLCTLEQIERAPLMEVFVKQSLNKESVKITFHNKRSQV